MTAGGEACDDCVRRAWLLGALGAHLESVRSRLDAVLALSDEDLVAAVGGRQAARYREELGSVDPAAERERARAAGVETVCRCDPRYPRALADLDAPPAIMHVAGGRERLLTLLNGDAVAVVGSRRASPYGLAVARSLAEALARAGITVISGMALGVDAAAHTGALTGQGATIAVLPGSAAHPYPARERPLYRRIVASGAAVSELPPGARVWRWTFPARNRIIAALAALTVVVEAGARSGSLVTARLAASLGREVGAVPGRVTSPQAAGTNGLLAGGAQVIRGAQDVLDVLFGAGSRPAPVREHPPLDAALARLLSALADGYASVPAFARAGLSPSEGLAALAELELAGRVRREPGGAYLICP